MSDNTVLNPGVGGDVVASEDIGGAKYQLIKQAYGVHGVATPVSAMNPLPVGGSFWQTTQPVSGAFYQTTQPVSGAFWQTTQPVSAAALPLPAGAATDATVAGANPYRGTSSYSGGTSGTVSVPAGARIVSMSAHATTAGSVAIFAGASVPIPAGNGFSDGWSGLVGPTGGSTIVFTGTDSYYVVVNL